MKFTLPSILRPKKSRSRRFSKADPSSFSSGSTASSDASAHFKETPKSVLPSADLRRDLVEVFKLLDRDGDGKISQYELELIFYRLRVNSPPTQEDLAAMLADADLDGDGCISLQEFGALDSALGPAQGSDLRDAFDYFDADGDGRISAEELLAFFSSVSDDGENCSLEDCRRMIAGVDRDGKGFVGYDDFVRMMDGLQI